MEAWLGIYKYMCAAKNNSLRPGHLPCLCSKHLLIPSSARYHSKVLVLLTRGILSYQPADGVGTIVIPA